jgi:hypothetical protein
MILALRAPGMELDLVSDAVCCSENNICSADHRCRYCATQPRRFSDSLLSDDLRSRGDRNHRTLGGFRQGRKSHLKENNAMDLRSDDVHTELSNTCCELHADFGGIDQQMFAKDK